MPSDKYVCSAGDMFICTRSVELISVGMTRATAYGNEADVVNIGARDMFRAWGVEGMYV